MWCVKLTEPQYEALDALLSAQGELGPALNGAREAVGLARWDDLPDAELDWDHVRKLAEAQGIGEGDVVWDLAAGMPAPAKSSAAGRGKSGSTRPRARRAR
jgi:hypothetical protein